MYCFSDKVTLIIIVFNQLKRLLMELILGIIATLSSTVAAVFGLGGGLILISFLPDFLPSEQIIPIHGVTQLASNTSRSCLVYNSIKWPLLTTFLFGSCLGTIIFGILVVNISMDLIPILIGHYILLHLWSKKVTQFTSRFDSYFILGFIQTGVGIVVGSTGHLTMPKLINDLEDRNEIVATSGAFMAISHGLKLLAYGILGFQFLKYALLLIIMTSGALFGSYIGTKIRGKINNSHFTIILKIILTILACKMIFSAIIKLGFI